MIRGFFRTTAGISQRKTALYPVTGGKSYRFIQVKLQSVGFSLYGYLSVNRNAGIGRSAVIRNFNAQNGGLLIHLADRLQIQFIEAKHPQKADQTTKQQISCPFATDTTNTECASQSDKCNYSKQQKPQPGHQIYPCGAGGSKTDGKPHQLTQSSLSLLETGRYHGAASC